MEYIVLAALSSTLIFVIFKIIGILKKRSFTPIVINYITAAVFGYAISPNKLIFADIFNTTWFYISLIIGVLFIVMFFLISLSSQKIGISITTVASKMSVIIPILFSIIYYSESITILKIFSICIAIIALILAVYQKQAKSKINYFLLFLPIILFLGLGFVDALVKFAQHDYVPADNTSQFSAFLFFIAFLTGISIGLFKKSFATDIKQPLNWFIGICLGLVNFGSIYFIMLALHYSNFDSSYVFGITNIAIVTMSALIGRFIFKERLSLLNWIGVTLAIVAIFLMIIA